MRISDWSSDVCSSDLDVPIIFISAKGSETDRIVGLELGADDYLPKPFGTRELIARIRAILRRVGVERGPDEHRENEARFDGWIVNFPRRELRSPTDRKSTRLNSSH